MNDSSSQGITRIKLEELNKHYQRLRTHYENLEQEAQNTPDLQVRLQKLYDGLNQLTFAQRKIHPEVQNLDAVWLEIKANIASPAFLQYWVSRLEKEVLQGKQRLEAALLFGLLLEESAFAPPYKKIPTGRQEAEEHWRTCWETESKPNLPALRKWFAKYGKKVEDARTNIADFILNRLFNPVTNTEIEGHLRAIVADVYRHNGLKKEVRQILGNNALITELAGTITILLQNFQEWQWKKQDCTIDSTWTRNKWRPYHQNNLLDTLFLEVLGVRWGIRLKEDAKNALFEDPKYAYHTIEYYRLNYEHPKLLLDMMPSHEESYYAVSNNRYGNEDFEANKLSVFDTLLGILHKELTYHQMRYKGTKKEKLYVTHIDIKDFFHTIPHNVLLEMLQFMGVPADWLAFFERYFKATYLLAGKEVEAKQGISLSHLLSTIFADILLEWLKPAMEEHKVVIYRVMDDIYLFAPSSSSAQKSWDTLKDFVAMCGLQLNADKCGAVCLHDKDRAKDGYLKQFTRLPSWMFLELQADATWQIDMAKVLAYQQNLQVNLQEKSTIFQIIQAYNADIGYLLRGLAPWLPLGKAHIESVNNCVATVHEHLFGQGQGIFALLRQQIIKRLPHLQEAIERLPEAWFFFPITAGGLALTHPLCKLANLYSGQTTIEPPTKPEINENDEYSREHSWANFHYYVPTVVNSTAPTATVVMESLMKDFIARGGEVSGSNQQSLGTYWQWLLYSYGPQLLEAFGTFRFLVTELVPLQVVYRSFESETGAGED